VRNRGIGSTAGRPSASCMQTRVRISGACGSFGNPNRRTYCHWLSKIDGFRPAGRGLCPKSPMGSISSEGGDDLISGLGIPESFKAAVTWCRPKRRGRFRGKIATCFRRGGVQVGRRSFPFSLPLIPPLFHFFFFPFPPPLPVGPQDIKTVTVMALWDGKSSKACCGFFPNRRYSNVRGPTPTLPHPRGNKNRCCPSIVVDGTGEEHKR